MNLEIRKFNGTEATPVVHPLYFGEGSGIQIRETDLFFVGYIDGEVAGSVRFCVEHETPMLRTMRVAKKFQGRGVGAQMLRAFADHLDASIMRNVFCLPYSHLVKFYGAIGFRPVADSEAPTFLQERLAKNRSEGFDVICMVRD